MSPKQNNPQEREDEDQERDVETSRVDRDEEDDGRGVQSSKIDSDADDEDLADEDEEEERAQEIDIEDLAAMEGPDA